MGELPHLKALVERHANDRFVLLGINTDSDREEYRRKAEARGLTWPNAWIGSTHDGLVREWAVDAFPTIFVLDADHVIRHVGLRGEALDETVRELLAELVDEG